MKIQNYFFSCVLFSFSYVSAMQQNGIAANLNGVVVNLPRVDNAMMQIYSTTMAMPVVGAPRQATKTAGKTVHYNTSTQCDVQQLLINAAEKEICAMNAVVEYLRDQIDENLLGIDKNSWFRSLIASHVSLRRAMVLNVPDAINGLKRIESYVPAECSSHINYQKLAERHLYVSALVNKLTTHEVEQFNNVKGSTIDALLDFKKPIPGLSQPMSEFIKKKAQCIYAQNKGLGNRLKDISLSYDDIHVVPLFGLQRCYLDGHETSISSDCKYIKAFCELNTEEKEKYLNDLSIDCCERQSRRSRTHVGVKIWDIENHRLSDVDDSAIIWREKCQLRNELNTINYLDRYNLDGLTSSDQYRITAEPFFFGGDGGWRRLRLQVRPTIESSLCQDAFVQSRGNAEALIVLRDSMLVQNLKGHVGNNLRGAIDQELQKLTN